MASGMTLAATKTMLQYMELRLRSFGDQSNDVVGFMVGIESIKKAISKALLLFPDGTVAVSSRMCHRILEGYGFSASERFEGVGAGGTVTIYFGNPQGSGRSIKIVRIEINATAQFYVDMYKGNQRTAAGTSFIILNLNFGSNIDPVAIVEYGGTYTLGDLAHEGLIVGGSGVFAGGGFGEVGGAIVLPEGTNFVLVLTNKSIDPEDIAVRFFWHEGVST